MPANSLSASTRKELCTQSRDLTALVKEVKVILPQFSDDLVCEALISSNEDIMTTVDYLLSAPFATKTSGKKKKKGEKEEEPVQEEADNAGAADSAGAGYDAPAAEPEVPEAPQVEEEPREERVPTAAEKQALKLKKKLREIERIEDRLAKNEKVDPLQLPKLEKKAEIQSELRQVQAIVDEEERVREQERQALREQARREAELEAQRIAEERRRAEAEEAERQKKLAEEAAYQQQLLRQQQEEARRAEEASWQQQGRRGHSGKGEKGGGKGHGQEKGGHELLSMLHANKGGGDYQQSAQVAQDLAAGRSSALQRGPAAGKGEAQRPPQRPPTSAPTAAPAAAPQQQSWFQQSHGSGSWDESTSWDQPQDVLMDEYSTPLNVNSIPEDKRRMAEKIAREIERAPAGDGHTAPRSYGGRGGGRGEGGKGDRKGGYGKGDGDRKGGYGRDRDGKGDYKGEKGDGKGKGKGKPKGDRDSRGPPAESNHRNAAANAPQTMDSRRLNW